MDNRVRLLPVSFFLVALCFAASGQQAQTVNLRPRMIAPAPGLPVVNVSVDRRRVPLGTQVIFSVTPAAIVSNPKYQVTLYFGDRQQRVLRTPVIAHVYPATGTYTYSIVVKATDTPDPGGPVRVSLVASPAAVEERRQVTFSAQVSRSVPNLQYRFDFGDGSQRTSWQSSGQTTHAYEKAGRYFPFVDIRDSNRQLGGSQKQSVAVTKTPPRSLSVSLTANQRAIRLRQPVTFNARVTPSSTNTSYWFDFGDGSQPLGWQASSRATHTYSQPGSYPAYVQVSQPNSGAGLTGKSSPVSVYVQRPRPTPSPGPSPQPKPTPTVSPTPGPSPNSSPSPTADTSPTPSYQTSPTPDGSISPGPTTSPNPFDSPTVGSVSPSPTADPSQSSSPSIAPTGPWSGPNGWWKYLLILAVILFLVYQATALLFAAQPIFTPYSDPGVAAVADAKGAVPIDFEMVLDPNVTAGDYRVNTDASNLITNAGAFDDRETLEI